MAVKGLKVGSLNTSDDVSGLIKVVPTSVAVGSGSGSADSLGTVTFSGASSVSLNGIFTSTYENYRIKVVLTTSGNATVSTRYRASNSDITSANYDLYGFYVGFSSALTRVSTNTQTQWQLLGLNTNKGTFDFELSQPNAAVFKINFVKSYSASSGDMIDYAIPFSTGTVADGLSIYVNTGTMSGTIRAYGYNN
jgi:hypothetical protein